MGLVKYDGCGLVRPIRNDRRRFLQENRSMALAKWPVVAGVAGCLLLSGLAADVQAAPLGNPLQLMVGGTNAVSSTSTSPVGIPVNHNAVVSPLTFNFSIGTELAALQTSNPTLATTVINGFNEAADLWRSRFVDPITLNVTINFKPLGAGILGQTSNQTVVKSYTDVRNALVADSKSADDATAVSHLQPSPSLDLITNQTTQNPSTRARDTDSGFSSNPNAANNDLLDVSRSNLKALGLLAGNDGGTDGAITFASGFNWDYDRINNDIAAGSFDFVGVAAHEIGHLMGFTSGVDSVDVFGQPNGPGFPPILPIPQDLDDFAVYSVLDLYRYSDNSLAAANQPANGAVLDLAFGELGTDTPFFSIDAGVYGGIPPTFSTGVFNGDGRQASHWEDNLGLGIMDPTLAKSELGVITALDVQAFDVIGFDVVPEPGTGLLLAVGGLLVIARRGRVRYVA